MQISISGQQFSVGNALQEYVRGRTQEVVSKYFDRTISAHIYFSKQGIYFVCEPIIHEGIGKHMTIKSDAMSDDVYTAFDMAILKLEKQLRRYKSKIKGHHDRTKISEVASAAVNYTINPNFTGTDSDKEQEESDENDDNPVIIAEKPIDIMALSVSEAVMKMDLEDLPALMFQNAKTGRINVVYYRKDGNISWVDSK